VDRAKTFYTEKAGFNLDVDHRAGDQFRVVQMTPPDTFMPGRAEQLPAEYALLSTNTA